VPGALVVAAVSTSSRRSASQVSLALAKLICDGPTARTQTEGKRQQRATRARTHRKPSTPSTEYAATQQLTPRRQSQKQKSRASKQNEKENNTLILSEKQKKREFDLFTAVRQIDIAAVQISP
jgi:hypothetical protein